MTVNVNKFFWAIRMWVYSIFYRNIKFPGYLGKPILLKGKNNITLGKKVRIFPNSRFESHGKNSYIHIHEDVSIGQGFHVTSAGKLDICSGTVITGNVVVTNIDHVYEDIDLSISKQPFIVKDTRVGRDCFIGFGAVIQAGTILGDHCIVGANSVVRGTFPSNSVIVGSPARIVKHYNNETEKWERYD